MAARTGELSEANIRLQEMLSERREIERKLAYDACHDGLTNLPNRTLLLDRLDNVIKRKARSSHVAYAVMFLDLDRFKIVNDSMGPFEGDRLLQEVATRLISCVRPGDTIARLGGDEFCILLDDPRSDVVAKQIAERILEKIAQPFKLKNQAIFISASIGIALSTMEYQDSETALRDADVAMYYAKNRGKAQYAVFDKSLHQRAINLLKLENELRNAVDEQLIHLVYQPIIDLESGIVVGFEALARWTHQEFGVVSPVDFIPIAEETGLIVRLGLQILRQAIEQVRAWRELGPCYADIAVSVNLPARQIERPELCDNIFSLFDELKMPHDAVKFEITESLLIHNFDQSKLLLSKLVEQDFQVMLDDLGTGYSSLSYLHHFPIHALKIDRSFVSNLESSVENKEIVRTIKALTDSLGMGVIAEGIETQQQLALLKSFGFKQGQGYYFSRPLRAEDVEGFLRENIKLATGRQRL